MAEAECAGVRKILDQSEGDLEAIAAVCARICCAELQLPLCYDDSRASGYLAVSSSAGAVLAALAHAQAGPHFRPDLPCCWIDLEAGRAARYPDGPALARAALAGVKAVTDNCLRIDEAEG